MALPPNAMNGTRSYSYWSFVLLICNIRCALAAMLDMRAPSHRTQQYNGPASAYYVDGTTIPDIPFDVGESYAGQMPIGNDSEMFFWFFPTTNPVGKNDMIIWLNGGPGCSSLEGLLQENGPISWNPGASKPTPNPWSWHRLVNVVWVEYPIGTGFSTGLITAKDNDDLTQQFLSFWENFTTVFDLEQQKIFLTGESYGSVHISYIGACMLSQNLNIRGALIYSPIMPYTIDLGLDIASIPEFIHRWKNDTISLPDIEEEIQTYFSTHLTYPPPQHPWRALPKSSRILLQEFYKAARAKNPCFNQYNILSSCPVPSSILGSPGGSPNNDTWSNHPSVRKALHINPHPMIQWKICSPTPIFANTATTSWIEHYNSSSHSAALKSLLEATNNVMIISGEADAAVFANSTALAIQNLVWNGQQGFQTQPRRGGILHTERGLTFGVVDRAGHEVPRYAPKEVWGHLEIVLERKKL